MDKKNKQNYFIKSIHNASLAILGAKEADKIFSAISGWDGGIESLKINSTAQIISELGNEFSLRYHQRTAEGLLLRIGEAAFANMRMGLTDLQELGSLENRLKPLAVKYSYSIAVLAAILSELSNLMIKGFQKEKNIYCLDVRSTHPEFFSSDLHLFFFAGILRGFGVWMDSRKEYTLSVCEEQEEKNEKLVCFRYSEIE
ncbi:MAG: hypothetical protein J7L66_05140 [Anaerolineaceae bacterium]|nr:hypothetical protein [Anaerolineaceae bacterium]